MPNSLAPSRARCLPAPDLPSREARRRSGSSDPPAPCAAAGRASGLCLTQGRMITDVHPTLHVRRRTPTVTGKVRGLFWKTPSQRLLRVPVQLLEQPHRSVVIRSPRKSNWCDHDAELISFEARRTYVREFFLPPSDD